MNDVTMDAVVTIESDDVTELHLQEALFIRSSVKMQKLAIFKWI